MNFISFERSWVGEFNGINNFWIRIQTVTNDLGTSLFYWTAFKGAKSAIFKGNCVTNQSFSVFEGLINENKWFLIGSLDVYHARWIILLDIFFNTP